MTEPTAGEIMRRLDGTTAAQERLTFRLEKLIDDADAKYATKELVNRDINEVRGDIKTINDERRRDLDWRRQASLALATAVLAALVAIAIAIFAAVTR